MHYAWVIVGILAVVQMIDSSIGMAAGIMVDPLSDPDGDFGWSVGAIGAAIAVYFVVGAVFAPITGWLGDRYGARRMMLVSAILFFGGMFFLGAIGQVWHLILAFGIILALTSSITYVALMAAVSPWFRRRLGSGHRSALGRRRGGDRPAAASSGLPPGQRGLAGHLPGA